MLSNCHVIPVDDRVLDIALGGAAPAPEVCARGRCGECSRVVSTKVLSVDLISRRFTSIPLLYEYVCEI